MSEEKTKIYSAYCHGPRTLPMRYTSPHTYADKKVEEIFFKGKEVLAVLRVGAYDPNTPFWMIPGYISNEQDVEKLDVEVPVENRNPFGTKTFIERKLDDAEKQEFEGIVKKVVDAPVEFW